MSAKPLYGFFAKVGGHKPGQENTRSHYRKGVAGDWANHFTPDHCEYFKKHYNEVLLKLGYETSPDWWSYRPGRQTDNGH